MGGSRAKLPLPTAAPGFPIALMGSVTRNLKEMPRGCCRLLQGLGKLCCFLLEAVQRAEGCQSLCLARALLAVCWEEQAAVPRGLMDRLCHPSQLRWSVLLPVMAGPSPFDWTVKKCNKKYIFFWKNEAFPISHIKAAVLQLSHVCYAILSPLRDSSEALSENLARQQLISPGLHSFVSLLPCYCS